MNSRPWSASARLLVAALAAAGLILVARCAQIEFIPDNPASTPGASEPNPSVVNDAGRAEATPPQTVPSESEAAPASGEIPTAVPQPPSTPNEDLFPAPNTSAAPGLASPHGDR